MSAVTNLITQGVSDGKTTLEGRTLSRPALIYTDGVNVTYGVDVDIGREGVINENGDLGMLPLYNVPIAAGNNSLIYAEVGSAVTLSKGATGQWQVVGFAKTYPGTFTVLCIEAPLYCLTVPTENPPGDPAYHTPVLGTPYLISETVRPLTYEELATYGTYGETCYGATGVFIGEVLQRIVCPSPIA